MGAVSNILRTSECVTGFYPCTLAALRLFLLLTDELHKGIVCTDFHSSFARFDIDGDGHITRDEFDKVRRVATMRLFRCCIV
jgi:hypothetical protein